MASSAVTTPAAGTPTYQSWAALVAAALNPCGCVLLRTAAQTIGDTTDTAVTFPSGSVTETLDTDGFHDTGSATSRITIPTGKAGWYDIKAQVSFAANATGQRQAWVEKNGSAGGGTELSGSRITWSSFGTTTNRQILAVSALLAEGDYITLNVRQSSTGNLDLVANGVRFECLRRWPA